MAWQKPPPQLVWQAIETYLRIAYKGPIPSAVRARLETLRSMPPGEFYDCSVFEHSAEPCPPRYFLRLGNYLFPHMKLAVERSPDGRTFLFRADTHDEHCCPEFNSREYRSMLQLLDCNRELAQAIEAAWAAENLPTFKTFLRADLARRAADSKPAE